MFDPLSASWVGFDSKALLLVYLRVSVIMPIPECSNVAPHMLRKIDEESRM